MADENGEVAEAIVAPETVETTPEVVSTPEAETPKSEPKSLGESIRNAVERAKGDAEAKAEGGQPRAPDGKFAPKAPVEPSAVVEPVAPAPAAPEPVAEAPLGTPKEIRAAWGQIPAEARASVERMVQAFGDRYEPIRQFDERARSQGQTLAQVLQTYTGIEDQLRENPVQGLNIICQNMGVDLRQIAAQIAGQPHDVNAETQQLRAENARLRQVEQQYHGFQQQAQERALGDAQSAVEKFAAGHPRFEELSPVIGWALKSGLALNAQGAPDLQLAYEYAERLKPAPQPAIVAETHAAPAPVKAKLSMQGAPGSNPAAAKPSGSVSEAVQRALSRAQASI